MTQTAIIIRHGGDDILVRLEGVHVQPALIKVDTRSHFDSARAWQPKSLHLVEVRLETG